MHKVIFLAAFLGLFSAVFAQKSADLNELRPAGDGVFFMFFDTSGAKSTVVEFADFVAAIEAPIRDAGGSATWLAEHADGGEKMLRTLRHHFPTKPLRYLLHSHWHPHSISSVRPFLEAGATIVTTRTNFEKLTFVDPETRKNHEKQLIFVENDRFEIADATNRIIAHRFTEADYRACPTAEYLYFELPKLGALHVGCMFHRFGGKLMGGREMRSPRVLDVQKFVDSKGIGCQKFIRLRAETGRADEFQTAEELRELVSKGVTFQEIWAKYFDFPLETWQREQPKRLAALVSDSIPPSILNSAVYDLLRKKKLDEAAFFAQIQTQLAPENPNSWDTLGEAMYFLGERDLAVFFAKKALLIDPKYRDGGLEVWKKNLAAFEKFWAEKK